MKPLLNLALAVVLGCFVPPQAAAQIAAKPSYGLHEPIDLRVEGAPDVVFWRLPSSLGSVSLDDGKRLLLWAPGGSHTVTASCLSIDWDARRVSGVEHSATFSVGPVVPSPNPPQPEPPTPVVSGKRTILLVYETGETTPRLSGLITQLRDGQAATWIANRGHALWCLDDDSKTPEGLPLPLLQPYRERNPPLPALLILDAAGSVLFAGSVPATADAVVELVKRHGG